jgi:hypothetical protein
MGVPAVKDTRPRPSPIPASQTTLPYNPCHQEGPACQGRFRPRITPLPTVQSVQQSPPKKKSKKILGTAKISATILIVLGGTTARCSNRCSGL